MQEIPASPKSFHYRPGHARGEDTARRMLDAAIEVFADEGYEGASTRMLAERGDVNLPAIQYYFGSKEGLYRAAIRHIAELVESRMAVHADQAMAALARDDAPSDEALVALFLDMLDGFVDLVTCHDAPPSAGLMIARAEFENAEALEVLQQAVERLVFRPGIALLARLLGRPEDDEEIRIRCFAIFGQAIPFKNRGPRMGACPILGWLELDERRVGAIRSILREQTAAMLRVAKAGK